MSSLKEFGKGKKNTYTVEQLLNPQLKNTEGESNEEVRKRMFEFINNALKENLGKRIAMVSHGAAIKFLMQNWCEYVYEEDSFYFNDKFVCSQELGLPSLLKLVFDDRDLISLKNIKIL